MGKHGSLTYKQPNSKIIRLPDNLEVRVMVINSEVARVRFTDGDGEAVPFPEEVSVRKIVRGDPDDVPERVVDDEVFITKYHSYIFTRGDNVLFRLENQGQQAIEGPAALVVVQA